jgi:hypothetical protein
MKIHQPGMIRFQVFVTPSQYEFLRKWAYENKSSGGEVIRAGINSFAKRKGVILDAAPATAP